jgi:hypothetical protein
VTAAEAGRHGSARRRHLGISLVGLVAACAIQNRLPLLTVALRAQGLSLAAIDLLVSAPARPERSAGAPRAVPPYRSPVLWQVHGPTLLVVPWPVAEASPRGAPRAATAASR